VYWRCCPRANLGHFSPLERLFCTLPYNFLITNLKLAQMAKVLFTAFMADARGKVNGTVFSKNRGGAYTRTKVSPSNPQTTYQTTVRQRLASFSASFRGLTALQIVAWNNAVNDFLTTNVFGNTVKKTGLQLYVGLNSNIDLVGGTPLASPPAPVEISTLTASINTLTNAAFTVALGSITTDEYYVIEATPSVSPGRNFLKNEFRVVTTVVGTGSPIAAQNIFAAYSAKFGAPVTGQRLNIRVKVVNSLTGQAGIPVMDTQIVA
jgi:hypothetical protein